MLYIWHILIMKTIILNVTKVNSFSRVWLSVFQRNWIALPHQSYCFYKKSPLLVRNLKTRRKPIIIIDAVYTECAAVRRVTDNKRINVPFYSFHAFSISHAFSLPRSETDKHQIVFLLQYFKKNLNGRKCVWYSVLVDVVLDL